MRTSRSINAHPKPASKIETNAYPRMSVIVMVPPLPVAACEAGLRGSIMAAFGEHQKEV
jgi:hypothetical protein